MTPVNLLLIAITAILSWMAFNNRKLADRLGVTVRKLSELDTFESTDPPEQPRLITAEIRQTSARAASQT